MKGQDLVYELPLTLSEILEGTQKTIAFTAGGKREQINVRIPKGMIDGKKIRLSGKGEPSPYGGPAGDLFIKSKIIQDGTFRNDEYDVYLDRTILLTEALTGTSVAVPTLDGKTLSLKIAPGTQHKAKLRIPGRGLPRMQGGKTGDLFVQVHIPLPRSLTDEQKTLVEQLAASGL